MARGGLPFADASPRQSRLACPRESRPCFAISGDAALCRATEIYHCSLNTDFKRLRRIDLFVRTGRRLESRLDLAIHLHGAIGGRVIGRVLNDPGLRDGIGTDSVKNLPSGAA